MTTYDLQTAVVAAIRTLNERKAPAISASIVADLAIQQFAGTELELARRRSELKQFADAYLRGLYGSHVQMGDVA